jgi:hypothetical protein
VSRSGADGGYADQSHLHRDVVAFTSATPATVAIESWLAVDDICSGCPDRLVRADFIQAEQAQRAASAHLGSQFVARSRPGIQL